MSARTNIVAEFPGNPNGTPLPVARATRPWYWSVRREVWENRSLYLAPGIVTVIATFGSLVATLTAGASASPGSTAVLRPLSMAPAPIMLTTFIVGWFYSIDALYGERRDRSILFWKSLPVSDVTTVLAKVSVPLLVLPLIGFALSLVTQLVLLPVAFGVATSRGMDVSQFWSLVPEPLIMIYGLTVHALWFAPINCWFLLVSAMARRAPLLWAIFPLLAIAALERVAFGTTSFIKMLGYRMTGAMKEAFAIDAMHNEPVVTQAAMVNFLGTPGLWLGLAFSALCVVAAIRLRRDRVPI